MTRFVSRSKAAEFNLDDLESPLGRSGFLCVSQSTWELAYSLVSFYGYWRSRYYKLDENDNQVTLTDDEWERVTDIVDIALEELSMTGYDELIDVMTGLTDVLNDFQACCAAQIAATGQLNDGIASDGLVSVGQSGDTFQTTGEYYAAKCAAANAIYDTMLGIFTDLDQSDIETIVSGVAGGATAVLSAKIAASGVLGWAISKVGSAVVNLAYNLISLVVSFTDIKTALTQQHEPLVLGLYNASNASIARSNFMAALGDATQSLTTSDETLVFTLLTNDLLNQLFNPRLDTYNYTSPNPIACGTTLAIWTFAASGESWLFRDDSDSPGVATGQWSSPDEGWEIDLTPGGAVARGVIYITGLSIAVDVGNSVQFDYTAPSDGGYSTIRLKVIYSDTSEDNAVIGSTNSAGTIVASVSGSKTISSIECLVGRSHTSSNNPYTQVIQEVRVQ